MGNLASELGAIAEGLTEAPRVYCDANLPIGLIRFMRDRLRWDVFFVMEEEDLRRASDIEHFRMAAQLRRTLLTLDHDYLDDALFPLAECGGVLVLSAPASRNSSSACSSRSIACSFARRPTHDPVRTRPACRCSGASCTCMQTGPASWGSRDSRNQCR